MLLAALIGLGLPQHELQTTLREALPLKRWRLQVKPTERNMWPAWMLRVIGDRPIPSFAALLTHLQHSRLPAPVRRNAIVILEKIRRAEAKAHGHSHGRFDPRGLGRLDTLVDILGNAWGFWRMGISTVDASAINTGRMPPAARAMLTEAKASVFSDSSRQELATPTGVAIITHYARRYGPMKPMKILRAGYGAGTLQRRESPNILIICQGN